MNSPVLTSPNNVIERVRAEMARLKISQSAVSKEIGISAAAFTQVLNGTYAADPTAQYEKLEKWLEQKAATRAARKQLPVAPDFVPTPTAERITAALAYAQLAGDIALVYGGAGLGKTTTLLEFQRNYNNVWIATMSPATATTPAALEEIALAMGIKQMPFGSARLQREIVRRMTNSGGLLIIDDAQALGVSALDTIRTLHDASKIGVVLCGNETVYSRMSGNRAAYLDRLHSRIGKRTALRRPLPADVDDLAAAFHIDDAKSLAVLRALANNSGALRLVVKVLRLAGMRAAGDIPTTAHIEAAAKELGV